MPRNYKKKDGTRKYGYSHEAMTNAMKDVRENGISIKKAAFLYGINRSTLINHLKGYRCGAVGRPTILTPAEEAMLVHALKKLGEWGFGIDRSAVRCIVTDFLNNVGRQHVFQGGQPGMDWMYGFENRWKAELSRRVAQPMPASRAYACNAAVVDDFLKKLGGVMQRLDLTQKPQNIFNVDETGFQTDIGSQKIFCKRGVKNPHKTVASSTKTMYTVQVCCSAVGEFLPMYVVYKGKHLYSNWCGDGPAGTLYNCSPSGWMESDQFVEWFEKVFVAGTSKLDGHKLLIFDGHNSHISTRVVTLAQENKIELFCLPAHTSSILQPLDVGVFKTVKCTWGNCLRAYYDETRYSNVDKRAFPGLLKQLVDGGAFSRANAISAFEACGIYPLNRQKISEEKLSTSVPLVTADGPASCNETSVPNALQSDLPSTSTAASPREVLSPRKGIETAILTHLRQITPANTTQKRTRIRRTLAECLTSEEASKRLQEQEEQRKKPKKAKAVPLKVKVTQPVPHKTPVNSCKQLTGRGRALSKYRRGSQRPDFHQTHPITIRKPLWLSNMSSQQQSPCAQSAQLVLVSDGHDVSESVKSSEEVAACEVSAKQPMSNVTGGSAKQLISDVAGGSTKQPMSDVTGGSAKQPISDVAGGSAKQPRAKATECTVADASFEALPDPQLLISTGSELSSAMFYSKHTRNIRKPSRYAL